MKQETTEYNYDWMLWSILENAAGSDDGTAKEYRALISLVPHFREVLDALVRCGREGVLLLKLLARYLRQCIEAKERGKRIALTSFCVATPILYAFDVVPMCLEALTVLGTFVLRRGTAEYLDYCCEVGFTETSCSAQRGALGAVLAGLAVRPDFIVCDSPGICDTNANSFAFAGAYLDVPFFQLNYPPTLADERANAYHHRDFRHLISFLEEQTGRTLQETVLSDILQETRIQDEISCELMELQRLVPAPAPGIYDLMLYGGKFMMGGTPEYTELLRSMVKRARENAKRGIAGTTTGRERARGLFCYIDHYTTDMRFWSWLNDHDITHLGSMLFTFWQEDACYARGREEEGYRIETGTLDDMIGSLAGQMSRMPMVKQIRGPYDAPHMWLDDTICAARLFKADFVAYIGTMGCRNTWGMVKLLARDLERLGIPALVLYADAFDDRIQSWEAITDRIEEFIHLRRIGV
ncbi:MAG: 2-hydroxyacyl-CoA dehydratase [Deltaproteobacteria bacterium]|nr:2-hydroxyacyl-CoA dehydratase [Deltaproteobacteria bacterium]